jgi:glycosyltransferase involved in cell wall biosynthesis
MRRIVYCFYSTGGRAGGHKMTLRHVETLRDLGFDAVAYTGKRNPVPDWFAHRAPILFDAAIPPDRHLLVLPEDAVNTLTQISAKPYETVVFVQNHFGLAEGAIGPLDLFPADRFPRFIGVSPSIAAFLHRLYPTARVDTVPAFADERWFTPGAARADAVALVPRKRPLEAKAIRALFQALHPRHAGLDWRSVEGATEAEVAQAFASSSLFLSLSKREGLGMTPLEAMACGCVCAGFTGLAGRDYATADNGFWVGENDCVAAADALARAADLIATGGPALARHRDAVRETSRQWSYAAFRQRLEEVWMQIAPEARIRNGPLD